MRLILLGTTGYHPNDLRHTACLMLPEIGVVLDAGTAMYRVRNHLATERLDIFLTHAHLDHSIGLTYLFDVLHEKSVQRVVVHGEGTKLAAIDRHLFAEELFPVRPPFTFQPFAGPTPIGQSGVLSFRPLEHPGGSLAFRLDWPDRSLAYVTDTTATADAPYLDFIRGATVLVHECYFPDSQAELARLTGHSCATPVAQLAKAADVGRLILVHMNPIDNEFDPVGLNAARAIFPATDLGSDGLTVDF